ncbi:MAG: CDGSH iron-sulfur domain-containing protein [bacterium]
MTTICKVIKNGPLEVNGNFEISGTDGKKMEIKGPIYLCRCGESRNKPFCDGTHGRNNFQA